MLVLVVVSDIDLNADSSSAGSAAILYIILNHTNFQDNFYISISVFYLMVLVL